MQILTEYFKLQKEIYDYFGYKEDWVVIPIEDGREFYWYLNEDQNFVKFANTEEELMDERIGDYYENEIYRQRFLPKWVYRAKEYTMIVVDTHVDGNKFLQIFDNKKEKTIEEIKEYNEQNTI